MRPKDARRPKESNSESKEPLGGLEYACQAARQAHLTTCQMTGYVLDYYTSKG